MYQQKKGLAGRAWLAIFAPDAFPGKTLARQSVIRCGPAALQFEGYNIVIVNAPCSITGHVQYDPKDVIPSP